MSEPNVCKAELSEKIKSCESLPALPNVANSLLEVINDKDATPASLSQIIECDPAICLRILNLANSPLYGLRRPVSSVAHAVVLLGAKPVSQLALSMATKETFCDGSGTVLKLRKKIYEQSLASATSAKVFSRHLEFEAPEESFMCGVMQDIGKLILLIELGEQYCDLLLEFPSGETTSQEQQWIGIGHDELGRICGGKWGLPGTINKAIAEHHAPLNQMQSPLSKSVLIANYFARNWHIGFEVGDELPPSEEIEDVLDNSQLDDIRTICQDSFQAIQSICA